MTWFSGDSPKTLDTAGVPVVGSRPPTAVLCAAMSAPRLRRGASSRSEPPPSPAAPAGPRRSDTPRNQRDVAAGTDRGTPWVGVGLHIFRLEDAVTNVGTHSNPPPQRETTHNAVDGWRR